jgi:predicted CxxxxCH...CXXCH cytochrome family protein
MDVEKVKVTAVTSTRVTVTGHTIGNSSFGTCSGTYCHTNSSNGAITVVLGANSTTTQNGLSLTVEHITDGTAILTIAPAA